MSVTAMECSRTAAVTISTVPAPDDATFRLLHEIRLRGVVEIDETEIVTVLIGEGFVVQSARGIRITAVGRDTHASWARLPDGENASRSRAGRTNASCR